MYKQFAEPQLLGGDPRGDETDPPDIGYCRVTAYTLYMNMFEYSS